MSLRKRVFTFIEKNNPTLKTTIRQFPDGNKTTVKRYFFAWKKINEGDITDDIILDDLDTIAEMTKTIQLIKDPVKRAENLARLHTMKLKPIPHSKDKTLKELFENL